MFVTGPEVVKTVTNEAVTAEALGGARTHTRTSGVAHLACANDVAAMGAVRELVSFLPSSNREKPPRMPSEDPPTRCDAALDTLVPADPNVPYDMGALVRRVLDDKVTRQPQYRGDPTTAALPHHHHHHLRVVAWDPTLTPWHPHPHVLVVSA